MDYRFQLHYICGHKQTHYSGYGMDITPSFWVGEEHYCHDCNDLQRVIRVIILDNQYQGHSDKDKLPKDLTPMCMFVV